MRTATIQTRGPFFHSEWTDGGLGAECYGTYSLISRSKRTNQHKVHQTNTLFPRCEFIFRRTHEVSINCANKCRMVRSFVIKFEVLRVLTVNFVVMRDLMSYRIVLHCIVVGSWRLMLPGLTVQTLVFSLSDLHRQVSSPETPVVKGGTTWERNGL